MDNLMANVDKVAKKLLKDKNLMKKFENNPAAIIEDLVGVDLPNDLVNKLIKGIKAKITAEQVGDVLEGIGKLFK